MTWILPRYNETNYNHHWRQDGYHLFYFIIYVYISTYQEWHWSIRCHKRTILQKLFAYQQSPSSQWHPTHHHHSISTRYLYEAVTMKSITMTFHSHYYYQYYRWFATSSDKNRLSLYKDVRIFTTCYPLLQVVRLDPLFQGIQLRIKEQPNLYCQIQIFLLRMCLNSSTLLYCPLSLWR